MRPSDKPQPESAGSARAAPAAAGRTAEGDAARRALEQTREALRSGEIAKAGETAVRELEHSLAGKPDRGDPGEVVARVVAVGDRRTGVPAVPLEDVPVRLKIDGKVIAEAATSRLGLVTLALGNAGDVAYEVEVVGGDCSAIACQPGRATKKSGADSHLIELPRTPELKPQLERAQPLEDAVRAARDRATLGAEVMKKALVEQEQLLARFVTETGSGVAARKDETARDVTPAEESPAKPGRTTATPKTRPVKPPDTRDKK